jgi:hypothetical protein
MEYSYFAFVKNDTLQENLDFTFNHIVDLLPLIGSRNYNSLAKSAFRKTVIIHTASIIEALLFYVVAEKFTNKDVAKYYGGWKLKNRKEIYIIDDNHKIVAGEYIKKDSKNAKEKLNLGQIATFLHNKKVLDNDLFQQINFVRNLRNEQHICTQKIVKQHSKKDLEKVFSVAKNVKSFVRELNL